MRAIARRVLAPRGVELHVRVHLALEVARAPCPVEERGGAVAQAIDQGTWRPPRWALRITRATASAMRSYSAFRSPSCFRPEAVMVQVPA